MEEKQEADSLRDLANMITSVWREKCCSITVLQPSDLRRLELMMTEGFTIVADRLVQSMDTEMRAMKEAALEAKKEA